MRPKGAKRCCNIGGILLNRMVMCWLVSFKSDLENIMKFVFMQIGYFIQGKLMMLENYYAEMTILFMLMIV